jgi:hypothetical protein
MIGNLLSNVKVDNLFIAQFTCFTLKPAVGFNYKYNILIFAKAYDIVIIINT